MTKFLLRPITPQATLEFEQALKEALRELGRQVLEWTLNATKPEAAEDQPHDVNIAGGGYRRLRDKTTNATLQKSEWENW